MIKHASAILVAVCAMVGTSAAEAQQIKITSGLRVPTAVSIDPESPDMQPRDGNNSWCVETEDGGLECGESRCGEGSEYSGCKTWTTNTSHDDLP